MKLAAAYIRVSTEEQTEYSPDSQLKIIREYAKRNDYIVPDEYVFIDDGISGKNTEKRPAFNRMIGTAKLKPKPFEAILLWKFSRFARNREDSIVYKSMLRKQLGIDVISVSENVGDDKMSILIEALIEAMDEYYSINLAEEVKRGMTEKATRGEPLTGASFGYIMRDKQYYADPETAPLVQMIFSDFLNGIGFLELAKKLNAMGIRTRHGNLWENRNVEYILRNPVYVGKIRWTPTGRTRRVYDNPDTMIVDGSHEALIDENTWEAVQDKIAEQKKHYAKFSRVRSKSEFMLQGLVRCSDCDATLVRTGVGLQCHRYSKGLCQTSHYISIDLINAAVIDRILQDFSPTADISTLKINVKEQQPVEDNTTVTLIASEKRKLQRVKEAYEAGIDTLEEYKANKLKITNKIKELEQQAPTKVKKFSMDAYIKKVRKLLPTLTNKTSTETEKNKALRQFVDKITFDRVNNVIKIHYHV